MSTSGFGPQSQHHLVSATQMFNSILPPSEAINAEALLLTPVTQKNLSSKLDDYLFKVCGCLLLLQRVLDSILTLPNFRLLSSGGLAWTFPMVHAAHCALRLPWIHLAIMLLPAKGVVMWFHATTKLRDILAESCRRAHLGVQMEMDNNLTNHSHTRPADLLVPNRVLGKPAAFDLSVTSLLNPTTLLEASVTTGVAALTTGLRKHLSNDTKCKELDWVCVPLVVESYGAWFGVYLPASFSTSHLLVQGKLGSRQVLKWWLGMDTSSQLHCPYCPDHQLDPLGHDAVTCKGGGDVVLHHNSLRDVFAQFCHRARLGGQLEVGHGYGAESSLSRPADILVPNWMIGKPAAFDLTVVSPLNSTTLNEAGARSGSAAGKAEVHKHNANDASAQSWAGSAYPWQ
eukprot:Em0016g617a